MTTREEFEAAFPPVGGPYKIAPGGRYVNHSHQDQWQAWQAATERAAVKCDAVVAEYLMRGDYGQGYRVYIIRCAENLAASIRGQSAPAAHTQASEPPASDPAT